VIVTTDGNVFYKILGYELIINFFGYYYLVRIEGSWVDRHEFGGLFCKVSGCGYIFRKFRTFLVNVCGAWVNCCRVWVCKKCMDRGLVVIKLFERWLDQENCRKIAGEVA